jgi:hypothetical protein
MGALGVITALSRTDQTRAEEIRDILITRAAALSATLGGAKGTAAPPAAALWMLPGECPTRPSLVKGDRGC